MLTSSSFIHWFSSLETFSNAFFVLANQRAELYILANQRTGFSASAENERAALTVLANQRKWVCIFGQSESVNLKTSLVKPVNMRINGMNIFFGSGKGFWEIIRNNIGSIIVLPFCPTLLHHFTENIFLHIFVLFVIFRPIEEDSRNSHVLFFSSHAYQFSWQAKCLILWSMMDQLSRFQDIDATLPRHLVTFWRH